MQGVTDRIDAVIADGSLRRLAHERSEQTSPVLIEIAGPTKAVDINLGRRGGATIGAPTGISVNANDGSPPEAASEEVLRVLGRSPRYLRAARAYAAIATGAQLAALAASPLIHAIRPNRPVNLR
jgi:hypothetical protein